MNIKIIAVGIILMMPTYASKAITDFKQCNTMTCPSNMNTLAFLVTRYQCKTSGAVKCYTNGTQQYAYRPCTSCEFGYTLTTTTFPNECGPSNTPTFKICDCICNNCTSDTDWSDVGAGYQKKVTKTCDCSTGTATCKSTTSYRCAKNYFGTSTDGTTGCARCWEDAGAVTKEAGSTSPTDCYIPKGTTFSDTTGSGKYSADCYYTK